MKTLMSKSRVKYKKVSKIEIKMFILFIIIGISIKNLRELDLKELKNPLKA